jgi:hypothetical protein
VSSHPKPVSRRARLVLGTAFAGVALVAASALAGIGLASNSPSAAQYQYTKIVAICHHTHSKAHPWVTLRINLRAWPGHLQHGDTYGGCTAAQLTPPKPKARAPKLPAHGHGRH